MVIVLSVLHKTCDKLYSSWNGSDIGAWHTWWVCRNVPMSETNYSSFNACTPFKIISKYCGQIHKWSRHKLLMWGKVFCSMRQITISVSLKKNNCQNDKTYMARHPMFHLFWLCMEIEPIHPHSMDHPPSFPPTTCLITDTSTYHPHAPYQLYYSVIKLAHLLSHI